MHRRRAGQHARETVRRTASWALAVLGLAIGVAFISGSGYGWLSREFVFAEFLVVGVCVGLTRLVEPSMNRWDRGAKGEEHVGKVLEDLRDAGWRVLHDVSLGRGNVDHILIGPGGLFTVETKSHAGRIAVDRVDPAMFRQAYAESKLVERICGERVVPLLVFSRAYIDRPKKKNGVVVLPARMLAGHLGRRPVVLGEAEVEKLHQRLAVALG